MFWIGFIVGGIAWFAFSGWYSLKMTNMSWKEFGDGIELMVEAGHNRESKLTLHYDNEDQNVVTFEEK